MSFSGRNPRRSSQTSRRPVLESLESRSLMATITDVSVPFTAAPQSDSPQVAALVAEAESTQISEVTLLVNGKQVSVTDGGLVELKVGDRLQVSGVALRGAAAVANSGGALAVEGYLRKTTVADPRGSLDYTSGLFSKGLADANAATASASALGLQGEWKLAAGNNQLQLLLVHYQGDGSEIVSRVAVNLQVGKPDFVARLDDWKAGTTKTVLTGEIVSLTGGWKNGGKGLYSNYAEVDIFHAADLSKPVWVGSLVGTANAGQMISGKFVNDNPNDLFAEEFVPTEAGEYVIRVTADPENYWQEANEKNNVVEYKLIVKDPVVVPGNAASKVERLEKRLALLQERRDKLIQQQAEVPQRLRAAIERLTARLAALQAD
jgi:hypothetical protein